MNINIIAPEELYKLYDGKDADITISPDIVNFCDNKF